MTKQFVFKGAIPNAASMLLPDGDTVTFWGGFATTTDPEVAAWLRKQPGISQYTPKEGEVIPTSPRRRRSKQVIPGAANTSSVTISPAELMQRATGNTSQVPQAAPSTSPEVPATKK